ncbi:hypothetical protein V5E97_09950 [Singulisphaera sp. Ch08]|uniref:Uncharacterized protein n=1 Tax=Singulisphaera sp. Ch08 TaxID=3120278 RepID=A0AAU7CLF6_9BACT
MAKFVWVNREDGFGQDAVDLHQCRRFLVSCPDPSEGGNWDHIVYYRTQNDFWIKESYEQELSGYQIVYCYEHAVTVAHDFLKNSRKLPLELEPAREIASAFDTYVSWMRGNQAHAGIVTLVSKPRWDRRERTLYFGEVLCRSFAANAKNQMRLLDAFEKENWPTKSISSPFGIGGPLKQTVDDFNATVSIQASFRFCMDNLRVGWKRAGH